MFAVCFHLQSCEAADRHDDDLSDELRSQIDGEYGKAGTREDQRWWPAAGGAVHQVWRQVASAAEQRAAEAASAMAEARAVVMVAAAAAVVVRGAF